MKQYLKLMQDVLTTKNLPKADRTGTGTRSIFGHQMRFNLQEGFPLVTTKKLHLKSIIHELIWFLAGDTNIKYLNDNGVRIWDEWADANGDLGPVYGAQWRSWPGQSALCYVDPSKGVKNNTTMFTEYIDQISKVVDTLRNNPDDRAVIVSAWNVADLDKMRLRPCHVMFQFYTRELTHAERYDLFRKQTGMQQAGFYSFMTKEQEQEADHHNFDGWGIPRRYLDCQLYQRSADVFLGVPFNIASYALLTHMLAHSLNMIAGDFVWTGGDCHLYSNHIEQARQQLTREERPLPKLVIKGPPKSIFDYRFEDFEIVGYDPHPAIKAQVAV